MARRIITLSIPDDLHKKMQQWKKYFNYSRLFQETVVREIQKKKEEIAREIQNKKDEAAKVLACKKKLFGNSYNEVSV